MHKPKAVVFDLGKVLLDFDYHRAARNLVSRCKVSERELVELMNQTPLLFRYETGLMTSAEFFEEIRRASQFCDGIESFAPLFGDIFREVEPIIELHNKLRERKIKTCIFSNTNELAIQFIRERYPFFSTFDKHILSYEHRAMKPEESIYKVVERELGLNGPDLLYIDDRPENIEAGQSRGWQAILHKDPEQTIRRVKEAGLL